MWIEHSFTSNGHTLRCVVTHHARGWEVRHEEDSSVVKDVVYDDWHRVERDLRLFDLAFAGTADPAVKCDA